MRNFLIISLTLVLSFSCKKNDNNEKLTCGVKNPLEELEWLKELVQKADNDTTGHYMGTIYLEKVGDEDAFFVEMAMGSGAIMGGWYDCYGNLFHPDEEIPKRDSIIYKNTPF
jgi:hypothetical protein